MSSITTLWKFAHLIIRSGRPGKADNLLKQIYSPGFRGIPFARETVADLITKGAEGANEMKATPHEHGCHEILI